MFRSYARIVGLVEPLNQPIVGLTFGREISNNTKKDIQMHNKYKKKERKKVAERKKCEEVWLNWFFDFCERQEKGKERKRESAKECFSDHKKDVNKFIETELIFNLFCKGQSGIRYKQQSPSFKNVVGRNLLNVAFLSTFYTKSLYIFATKNEL